jgi:AraC-like DNA-binding protein
VHQGSQIKARIEQGSYILRFSLEGNLAHDPRQFILATLAVLRNVILLAEEPEMVKVRLSLPYDRRCSAIEACLGEQLEFGCDYDEIEIRTELLDKPLSVSRNVGRIDHAIDTSVNAAVLISERLSRLPISIDCISAELGLTRRTLQRRLSECGLAFSDLVDVTRRDIAMQRLLTGNGSLKQLSFDLGYSDQAHFTRTFKRWMGTVPSEYRTLNRGRER